MRYPKNRAEWQEAVDSAAFAEALDSARQYGLIETDVKVNAKRCEEILRLGKLRGFVPQSFDKLCEKFLEKVP